VSLAAAFTRVVLHDPVRVAEAAASLHRPVHDEDGLADLLGRAAESAVRWLAGVDFAGITVQFDQTPFTVAGTDPAVLAVDALQYELDDGPSLQAMRTGLIVAYNAARAAARWPELAARAREHGVGSYLATPLMVNGVSRGSINLYSRGPDGFPGPEADFVAVISDYVSRGLADYAVLRTAQDQAGQMREAMVSRAPIEQAKGILMAVHQVTADAAFTLLRTQSQNTNTKLRDVAAVFVAAQTKQPLAEVVAIPPTMATATDGAMGEALGGETGGVRVGTVGGVLDFQSAFDHAPIGMAITDPAGVLLTVNPVLHHLLGGTPQALVGTTLFEVTHPEDVQAARTACAELREGDGLTAVLGVRVRNGTGQWVPVTVSTAKVLTGGGSPAHLVMHVQDDTDHHAHTEALRQQALHDPLTGLANRRLFLERLEHGAGRHHRSGAPLSVLFCDVDTFKAVNDTLGHQAGDAVLVTLADRLRTHLRPGDTAARLGGDEFAVLCENTDATTAAAVSQRLAAALAAPMDVEGAPLVVSVTIGAATSTPGGTPDPDALWKAADTAMYAAKNPRG
jgi:diguanylate cyclase (GGDEF)-like protein/PAS domain S-box-containing protein